MRITLEEGRLVESDFDQLEYREAGGQERGLMAGRGCVLTLQEGCEALVEW
jgi:hypothetical protein